MAPRMHHQPSSLLARCNHGLRSRAGRCVDTVASRCRGAAPPPSGRRAKPSAAAVPLALAARAAARGGPAASTHGRARAREREVAPEALLGARGPAHGPTRRERGRDRDRGHAKNLRRRAQHARRRGRVSRGRQGHLASRVIIAAAADKRGVDDAEEADAASKAGHRRPHAARHRRSPMLLAGVGGQCCAGASTAHEEMCVEGARPGRR